MASYSSVSVSDVQVESFVFPPTVKAPGSTKAFFLAGAGAREVVVGGGKFLKVTAIGVYLEEGAAPLLAGKWKGKTAEELMNSVEFFRDIVTGPFEKFTQVKMILPLTGKQYSEKVTQNCAAFWKEIGAYTDAETKALDKFHEAFESESFPPGASILFTQSPLGTLTISFSKDDSIPEVGTAVIEHKPLSETVLETIIGKQGVSPAAKNSLAIRLSELFNAKVADNSGN